MPVLSPKICNQDIERRLGIGSVDAKLMNANISLQIQVELILIRIQLMGKKKAVQEESDDIEAGASEPVEDEESYSEKKGKKKPVKKKEPAPTPKKKQTPAPKKETAKTNGDAAKPKKQKEVKPKETEKQDKKKDFLPGQKYPTPDEEDGALAFYKSLYQKNPKSEMAKRYCLEYGVLEPQEAAKVLKELSKAKK